METNNTRRTREEDHWMLDQIKFLLDGGCKTTDIVFNCENSILSKNVIKQRNKLEVKYY